MSETRDKRIMYLALQKIPRIGTKRAYELISHFGSIEKVFQQDVSKIKEVCKIKSTDFEKQFNRRIIFEKAKKELKYILDKGIGILTPEDSFYPQNLKNIPDRPVMLYYRGHITKEDINSVGIVGTRTPSNVGKEIAYQIAKDLSSNGVTVVSGLAKGIDTSAHKGCVDNEKRTIAVLGSGIDVIYPYENRKLVDGILATGGLLLSEFPVGTKPERYNFPQRNRIIAGITLGIVVVQSPEDSGSLITARLSNEYGRSVFSVPGSPRSRLYKGSNQLIKDGAILVENANDVLEQLKYELSPIRKDMNNIIEEKKKKAPVKKGYKLTISDESDLRNSHNSNIKNSDISDISEKTTKNIEKTSPKTPDNTGRKKINYEILTENEKKILPYMSLYEKKHLDQLCIESGININDTNKTVTSLLLKNLIEEHQGKFYTLKVDL